jgi:hypothetical protein
MTPVWTMSLQRCATRVLTSSCRSSSGPV